MTAAKAFPVICNILFILSLMLVLCKKASLLFTYVIQSLVIIFILNPNNISLRFFFFKKKIV